VILRAGCEFVEKIATEAAQSWQRLGEPTKHLTEDLYDERHSTKAEIQDAWRG